MKVLGLGLIMLTCAGCGWYYSSTSVDTKQVSVAHFGRNDHSDRSRDHSDRQP